MKRILFVSLMMLFSNALGMDPYPGGNEDQLQQIETLRALTNQSCNDETIHSLQLEQNVSVPTLSNKLCDFSCSNKFMKKDDPELVFLWKKQVQQQPNENDHESSIHIKKKRKK